MREYEVLRIGEDSVLVKGISKEEMLSILTYQKEIETLVTSSNKAGIQQAPCILPTLDEIYESIEIVEDTEIKKEEMKMIRNRGIYEDMVRRALDIDEGELNDTILDKVVDELDYEKIEEEVKEELKAYMDLDTIAKHIADNIHDTLVEKIVNNSIYALEEITGNLEDDFPTEGEFVDEIASDLFY